MGLYWVSHNANMADEEPAVEPLWERRSEVRTSHTVDLGQRIATYEFNETEGYVIATECCDGNFAIRVSLRRLRQRIAGLQRLLAYAERQQAKIRESE